MKTPVDECPAGPAMDAAVAKALGLCPHNLEKTIHWSEDGCSEACYECKLCHEKFWGLAYKEGYYGLPYSTDIAAAWELAETFRHGCFGLGWSEDWGVPYCMMGDAYEYGETIPLAICRAFLKSNSMMEIET